jgi:hypothetical protein
MGKNNYENVYKDKQRIKFQMDRIKPLIISEEKKLPKHKMLEKIVDQYIQLLNLNGSLLEKCNKYEKMLFEKEQIKDE